MKARADWVVAPWGHGYYDGLLLRGTVVIWRCEHGHPYPHGAVECAEAELERGEAELHRPGGGKGKAVVPVDANAEGS